MEHTQQKSTAKKLLIASAILLFLLGGTISMFFLGKSGTLPPEMQALRTFAGERGVQISGGLVRREHSGVRYKAIFSTESAGTKKYFFIEGCETPEVAQKRATEVPAGNARTFVSGTLVLYFSDEWALDEPALHAVKSAFLAFPQQ